MIPGRFIFMFLCVYLSLYLSFFIGIFVFFDNDSIYLSAWSLIHSHSLHLLSAPNVSLIYFFQYISLYLPIYTENWRELNRTKWTWVFVLSEVLWYKFEIHFDNGKRNLKMMIISSIRGKKNKVKTCNHTLSVLSIMLIFFVKNFISTVKMFIPII